MPDWRILTFSWRFMHASIWHGTTLFIGNEVRGCVPPNRALLCWGACNFSKDTVCMKISCFCILLIFRVHRAFAIVLYIWHMCSERVLHFSIRKLFQIFNCIQFWYKPKAIRRKSCTSHTLLNSLPERVSKNV